MTMTRGATVYVLDAQDIVQVRQVKTGEMRDSQWQIMEGIQPGDRVVVSGANKVKPGTKAAPNQSGPDNVVKQ